MQTTEQHAGEGQQDRELPGVGAQRTLPHHGEAERDDRHLGTEAAGPEAERLRSLRGELEFAIGRSRRYSSKRATHFARLDRVATLITLVSGSSVIASILAGWPILNVGAGVVVVLASLSSIGFRWSEEALHYTKQYRAYTDLAVRFARLGSAMTFDGYRQMRADYLQIESLERAPLTVLDAICFQEECGHLGLPDGGVTVRWWQRVCAQWVNLPPTPTQRDA